MQSPPPDRKNDPTQNKDWASSPTQGANEDKDLSLAAYNYELPQERIAQNPAIPRDSARLMVIDSQNGHTDRIFSDLPNILKPGDLLVLNNTRVIPARLYGRIFSGAAVEVLLLEELESNNWLALVKPGKRLPPGTQIIFDRQTIDPLPSPSVLSATVIAKDDTTGGRILQFEIPSGESLERILPQFGCMPLPPYIKYSQSRPEQYQTVYADRPGAVAAPTAGLHFTVELLDRLRQKGIDRVYVTLHVGVGTFRPIDVEDITAHKMHSEWVEVSPETVARIRETQANGGRIIAVGTTAVRSLEAAAADGELRSFCGKTELFIYPGYRWRVVEGTITNFHLPRSSLLMLVSAIVGRERLLNLYNEAIASEYRFYSFGDAMLILPEAVRRSGPDVRQTIT